jgi:hypothetical protein
VFSEERPVPGSFPAVDALGTVGCRLVDGLEGTWRLYGVRMSTSSLDVLPRVGAPATPAVHSAGYTTLKELAGASRADLEKLHGVGPKALEIIEAALKEHGLALR